MSWLPNHAPHPPTDAAYRGSQPMSPHPYAMPSSLPALDGSASPGVLPNNHFAHSARNPAIAQYPLSYPGSYPRVPIATTVLYSGVGGGIPAGSVQGYTYGGPYGGTHSGMQGGTEGSNHHNTRAGPGGSTYVSPHGGTQVSTGGSPQDTTRSITRGAIGPNGHGNTSGSPQGYAQRATQEHNQGHGQISTPDSTQAQAQSCSHISIQRNAYHNTPGSTPAAQQRHFVHSPLSQMQNAVSGNDDTATITNTPGSNRFHQLASSPSMSIAPAASTSAPPKNSAQNTTAAMASNANGSASPQGPPTPTSNQDQASSQAPTASASVTASAAGIVQSALHQAREWTRKGIRPLATIPEATLRIGQLRSFMRNFRNVSRSFMNYKVQKVDPSNNLEYKDQAARVMADCKAEYGNLERILTGAISMLERLKREHAQAQAQTRGQVSTQSVQELSTRSVPEVQRQKRKAEDDQDTQPQKRRFDPRNHVPVGVLNGGIETFPGPDGRLQTVLKPCGPREDAINLTDTAGERPSSSHLLPVNPPVALIPPTRPAPVPERSLQEIESDLYKTLMVEKTKDAGLPVLEGVRDVVKDRFGNVVYKVPYCPLWEQCEHSPSCCTLASCRGDT